MNDLNKINSGVGREWEPNFEIRLPPLPRTVSEVTRLLATQGETPDTPALVEIVNTDPVIGASVLRRINSAYYGMRSRVVDIEKACNLLGFEEVCDIVLTAGMLKLGDIFQSRPQIEIFERIMEMSLGAAHYNKKLAEHLNILQKGFAFTTGLLHTIGRLVLLYNRPDDYEALWFTSEKGRPPTVTSEQIIFGTDHAELGARAAEEWQLPDDAVTVIKYYLTPGHVEGREIRVLALSLSVSAAAADYFCTRVSKDDDATFSPPAALYALTRQVDMPPEQLIHFVEKECAEVRKFIGLMIDPKN